MAGRPAAVSSAMVEAPARAMTRCAQPSLVRHVLDIGGEIGGNLHLGIGGAHRLDILGTALLRHLQAAAQR